MKSLNLTKGTKIYFYIYMVFIVLCTFGIVPVSAEEAEAVNNPLTVVNNLSTFIFAIIRAVGMIILGFGIVQFGMALKSHDASQKANSLLTVAGGIIITFAKEILTLITGA